MIARRLVLAAIGIAAIPSAWGQSDPSDMTRVTPAPAPGGTVRPRTVAPAAPEDRAAFGGGTALPDLSRLTPEQRRLALSRLTPEQRELLRARRRERFARMSPEERAMIRRRFEDRTGRAFPQGAPAPEPARPPAPAPTNMPRISG